MYVDQFGSHADVYGRDVFHAGLYKTPFKISLQHQGFLHILHLQLNVNEHSIMSSM